MHTNTQYTSGPGKLPKYLAVQNTQHYIPQKWGEKKLIF